jgi:SAM-dependent methyltransferase
MESPESPTTPNEAITAPTRADLEEVFRLKNGDPATWGWSPRLRFWLGYFTPDEYYEALIAKLVREGTAWIELGCGRHILPYNQPLARMLADRCAILVGVDPSDNLEENQLVHQREKSTIEDFRSERAFDLATLQMVAEHITHPESAVRSISRLVKSGGLVVVYTINRWSPLSIISWIVPFRFHHAFKRHVWGTEEKDTFPVAYMMNTRTRLARVLGREGFKEVHFSYLSDCRIFYRYRLLHLLELSLWRLLKALRLGYPENCLLGVYECTSIALPGGE